MEEGKAGDPGMGKLERGQGPEGPISESDSRKAESRAQGNQASDFLFPTCATLFLFWVPPQLFLYLLQPLLKVSSLERPSQTTL